MSMVYIVHFMYFPTPPISRRSLVLTACMTEPAQRNSRALKNEWPIRWNMDTPTAIAPTAAPIPRPAIMKPSCDTVEKARTLLISKAVRPIVAANRAVKAPTAATAVSP
ncbi:Uncharacterised protein [uncultured archaeon]|nr:Uncharacterised protein [uncultured archaeon]